MIKLLLNNTKDVFYIFIIIFSGIFIRDHYIVKHELEIAEMNSNILDIQNKHLIEKEILINRYNNESQKLEITYNDKIKELDKTNNDLNNTVNNSYRLLDKANRQNSSCKQNDNSNNTTNIAGTEQGTELSKEASQFLFGLTYEADKDRAALNLCKDWIKNLKEANNEN